MKLDRPKPTANVWVSRDGRELPVRLMSDRHLMNTLRYLVRNAARIKQATLQKLDELRCTLDELDALGARVDLNDLPTSADDSCIVAALAACRSTDEIADLAECVELMNGDEVLRATIVTFPALVLEARRRGLIGRPTRAIAAGAAQLTGESSALQRVDVRVEPTRKGWE
jgi:hypothetical protein